MPQEANHKTQISDARGTNILLDNVGTLSKAGLERLIVGDEVTNCRTLTSGGYGMSTVGFQLLRT